MRLLFALIFFSSAGFSAPETKPVVITTLAKASPLFDEILYPAKLVSKVHATINADSEGVVERIEAPLGTSVKRNQRIIRIRHRDPVYTYSSAGIATPVDGVVSSLSVTEGGHLTKGQTVATVTSPSEVKIVIEVPAGELSALRKGHRGQFQVGRPARSIPVEIVGLSPWVDPASGTASVELRPTDAKPESLALAVGQVGRVSFHLGEHAGIEIPESALLYRGNQPLVRIVEDGKAKIVPVTIGKMRKGLLEILEGLKEGTTVILRANGFVGEGEEVQAESTPAAS